MQTSLHLLPPLDDSTQVVGSRVRAAGWWGCSRGLHTVAIRVANFQGRVAVQASIAADPAERDWYSVLPQAADYLQYPRTDTILALNQTGESSTIAFNFTSNAVWLRAMVDRSYLMTPGTSDRVAGYGTVSYVMVNY